MNFYECFISQRLNDRCSQKFNSILFSIQDGFMDMEEVHKWILPSDYDHTEAEAKHLVMTCQFL